MDSVTIEEKVFQVAGTFCGASEQPKLEPEDVPQENLEHPLSYSTVQNGQNHVSPHNVLQPQLEESPKQPDQEDQQQHDVVCVFYHLQRHQSNDRQDRGIADEEDEMREPRRESYLGVNQLLKQQAEQEHQSKEQEHQQDSMLFTSARTCRTRGKERLLEEDDFSVFHRCDTSQKESMPTKEQYPFPCGTHISSFADLSVPAAAHEFEYSSTRHGLRNEGVINAAQVLAAGKFSGTHEVVAMDYHVVPNEEQTVKSDEHTLTARGLDEMPWRTSQVITQQLEVPIADTQNVTSASVVTVPKAIENLHSYETATTAFRVFNNSPACPEQVATGFENFNDRQNAEEVPTHAALRVSNQSQLSEDASVAASIYRSEYFTDDDDTSISSENSRKNGHEIPFDICYKDDTAESQQQAHARSPEISFAEGSTGFKQERHDPNMAGADPYFEEAAGIKFLEIPAAVESKIKTEILSHPMFPEMLSAHVACLRVTVPQDHMLDLPGQLTRSQELLRAYSAFMPPNEGKNVQPREQFDEFMKSHTDALWNLHARLEHCIPHFVRDAMLFISKVENEAKSLLSLTEDEAGDAFESNTTGMAENDCSLWGFSKSEEYGPLVPTASERSIMERIREQLKQELTEEGYKKKIMEVRDEILRKRRAGKLPTGTTTVLKEWWKAHMSWPYPTEEDKESLMEETGLELKQINNWFINQRKRNWNNGASSSKSNDKKNKHKA